MFRARDLRKFRMLRCLATSPGPCHRNVPGPCSAPGTCSTSQILPQNDPGTCSTSQILPQSDPGTCSTSQIRPRAILVPVQCHKSCPGTIWVQLHKSCPGTILVPVQRHKGHVVDRRPRNERAPRNVQCNVPDPVTRPRRRQETS